MTLDLHIQIYVFCSIDQVLMRSYALRGVLSFSLLSTGTLVSFVFLLFTYSSYFRLSRHSISVFLHYHVWIFICVIALIVIYYSGFI